MDRFRIDKVLDYAFDGLLLTCEATVMHDKWTKNDTLLVDKSEKFAKLLALIIELCKLNQQSFNPGKQQIFAQKEQDAMKYSTSASELSFFACQLLTSASKEDLQAVLDENQLE